MEIYEIDLVKLKASFWDDLRAIDTEIDHDDDNVLAMLTVQMGAIEAIETQGTLKK